MKLKKKIIEDIESFFNAGEPVMELHFMKLLMWYSKCEIDLMELSHSDNDEYKKIIPEIVDVVILDFKKNYSLILNSSEKKQRFLNRKAEIFNKEKRFNEHLTKSDFDLLMDALETKYRKQIAKLDNPSIKKTKSNLTKSQETILSETKHIFDKKSIKEFAKKRILFLQTVFPKIEVLYNQHPSEFEEISSKIHEIMYKEEIIQITSFLKNEDFVALSKYKHEIIAVFRPKYVNLENSGNKRLCRFLLEYENSVQNWLNSKDGSQAILKDINKDKGHCYIATMSYGDYNHPNVVVLRNYRDNTLDKTFLGKAFIKLYYQISPILVRKIKHNSFLNRITKSILDKIVYKLKS
jgi:hypothetical protein